MSFENRDFLTGSSFDHAEFHGIANFHNATLKPFVTFDQANFFDLKTPPSDKLDYYEKLEGAYRTLKQIFEERRDFVKAGDFFVKELTARRKRPDLKWEDRFFSDGYELFSNFGVSVERPLIWLGAITLVMSFVYLFLAEFLFLSFDAIQKQTIADRFNGVIKALGYSLNKSLLPLNIWGNKAEFINPDCFLPLFKFIFYGVSALHSLAAIGLIFLFALALRRKFQMN